MRVFIGWSGERSKIVALALRNWLRTVNPSLQAWMSEEDIARGARWSPELDKELDAANVGILCLTRENLLERYIHYDAGALAKKVAESRVFTYLIGLEPNDVSGPLAKFQHTKADRQATQSGCAPTWHDGVLLCRRRQRPVPALLVTLADAVAVAVPLAS